MDTRLSVNVDHIATLRQARGTFDPDPLAAARLAEAAGAHGITVHLREDRRHVQDHDVRRLNDEIAGRLNLEISPDPRMVGFALDVVPDQVTLVPERPGELTTEGGLDMPRWANSVVLGASKLARAGVDVFVFLDPDPKQIDLLGQIANDPEERMITGFEINTDAYTRAQRSEEAQVEVDKIRKAIDVGLRRDLQIHAGHGLTADNVGHIAALDAVREVSIGHALISRAVMVGLEAAVKEVLAAMAR